MTNKDWALACAARGWLVFPSEGKMPKVKWSTDATTDPTLITLWWDVRWPEADVCIKTGADSGIVVVDWDAYKQPEATWPLDILPATYTTATPKGGFHFYFAHPGYPVSNSAGKLAPFIDVRGDGGMVVAYPSTNTQDLARLPEAWATRRTEYTAPVLPLAVPYSGDGEGFPLALTYLEKFAAAVVDAPEGERNLTLWRMTADAFKLVASGELREEFTLQVMIGAARMAGLHPDEVQKSIMSAREKGMKEPMSCRLFARWGK